MKKIFAIVLAACMILTLAACGGKANKTTSSGEETKLLVIPANFYRCFDYSPSEDAKEIKSLGKNYYTKVEKQDDGLLLTVTTAQQQKLTARMNYYISEYEKKLLSAGDGYYVTGSDDFTTLVFNIDEKMDKETWEDLSSHITRYYALNQIMNGAGTHWRLQVDVYNTNTGDEMSSATLPED